MRRRAGPLQAQRSAPHLLQYEPADAPDQSPASARRRDDQSEDCHRPDGGIGLLWCMTHRRACLAPPRHALGPATAQLRAAAVAGSAFTRGKLLAGLEPESSVHVLSVAGHSALGRRIWRDDRRGLTAAGKQCLTRRREGP